MNRLRLTFDCNNGSPFAFDEFHDLFTDGQTMIIARSTEAKRPPPITAKVLLSDPVADLLFDGSQWAPCDYADLLARLAPHISKPSNEDRRIVIGGCQFDARKVWDLLISVRALDSTVIKWRVVQRGSYHVIHLQASLWQAAIMGMRHNVTCSVVVLP
jgi:hypothetical protein